ncbi:MAG: hypothetical protein BWY17_04996 [Deltaproteobacteria bacterium ADurb.Bin207]|nr:MAG: hypothetical protein BWY17_04996 [Deltaproteobacteria bacterium ADurb.Bin207]
MTAKALAPIMIHLRSLGDGLGISRKRVVTFEDIQFAGAEFPRDVVDAIDILVGVGHAMPRREHDIGSDERARADRLVVWALVKHHHDGVIRRAGVERSVDDGVEPLGYQLEIRLVGTASRTRECHQQARSKPRAHLSIITV